MAQKPDVENTPTTILTQMGVTSCIPKLARGGVNGYTKRHEKKTPKK
jgi:hypothetical protein